MASSVAVPGPAAAGSCNQAATTSTDHGTRTVPFGHNKSLYSSLSLRKLPKFDAMFQQRVSHRQLNHGSAVPSYGAPSIGAMKGSTPGTSFRSSTSTVAQQQHSTNTKSSYRPPPRSTSTTRLSSYGAHNSAGTSVVSGAAGAFTVGTPQIVHRLGDGGGGGTSTTTTKITVGVPDLRMTLQKSMSERTLLLSTRANKLKPPTPLGIEKLFRVENWKLPNRSRLRPLRERVELEGGGEDNADEGAGASAFGTTSKPLYDSQEISKQLQQRRNRGENTQFAGAAALRGVVEGADATASAAASTTQGEELKAPSRVVHVAVRRDAGVQSSSSPVALPVETSPPSTGSAMQSQAKNEQRSTAGKASSQSPEDHDHHDAPGVVPPNSTPPLYADIRPVRVLVSAEDQHATSSAAAQHRGPTITTVESYNSKSSTSQLREQLQGANHSLEQQQQQNQNQNQSHLQRQQQSPLVQNREDHEQATMINPARGSSKQPQGDHRPLQKIPQHPDALLAKTARLRKKVEMEMSKTREGQRFAESEVGVSLKKVRYVEQQLRQARNELETSFGPMHLTSQRFKRQEQKVGKLAEDFKKAENKHREARGNQLELEEKFKILEKKLLHLRGIARNVFSGGAGVAGPAGARAPAASSSSLYSAGAAAGGAAPVVAAPSQPADGHSISMQPTPLEDGPEDSPLDPQVLTFQPTPVLNGGGLLGGAGRGAVALGSMNTVSSSFGRVGR